MAKRTKKVKDSKAELLRDKKKGIKQSAAEDKRDKRK